MVPALGGASAGHNKDFGQANLIFKLAKEIYLKYTKTEKCGMMIICYMEQQELQKTCSHATVHVLRTNFLWKYFEQRSYFVALPKLFNPYFICENDWTLVCRCQNSTRINSIGDL